jgi:crotonobetainyl-CoA:carnitine CoA-transferase CaiB-like acyl-CoA transferase
VVLLAALDHRRRTGEGCHIDVAQSEIGVFLLSPQLADYFDRGTVAQRRGNQDEQFAPHGVYPCLPENEHQQGRDRFVAIAVCDDTQWQALATQLRRPDLAADPGLADAAGRLARADELDAAVAAWTATQRAQDVEARLQAHGVPAHLAVTSADWARDPQLVHRGHLRRLPHERFGVAFVEGPRYLLSETPGQVTRPAPALGQDNERVLRGLLGYDQARYDQVAASGALA